LTDSILHPSIAPASNGASNSAGQAKAKAAEAPAVRRKSG